MAFGVCVCVCVRFALDVLEFYTDLMHLNGLECCTYTHSLRERKQFRSRRIHINSAAMKKTSQAKREYQQDLFYLNFFVFFPFFLSLLTCMVRVSNSLTSHLYTANENPLNFGMKYNSLASVRCHSPYFFSCSFDLFSRRRRRRPRGIHFRREERLCSCDLFFSSLRENRKKNANIVRILQINEC